MGNVLKSKKNKDHFNYHHVQIEKLLESCDLVDVMKTLLFLVKSSDESIVSMEEVINIMISGVVGRYQRMDDSRTFQLMLMVINELCISDAPERAIEYLTMLIDHAHDISPDTLAELKNRYNYCLYMNGQSERWHFPPYGDLSVPDIRYDVMCQYICLGHYMHKFQYEDTGLGAIVYNLYRVYMTLRMPLFKYFPELRCFIKHDERVLEEMYKIFVPYKNAGNIKVIVRLFEHNPDDMLDIIPRKYGLYTKSNGKLQYI